jgi:hypothetical protein
MSFSTVFPTSAFDDAWLAATATKIVSGVPTQTSEFSFGYYVASAAATPPTVDPPAAVVVTQSTCS